MDLKLSFILPIYNVEAYLPHCVNSILNQMTDACEIILVDDGTRDHSGQICDDYAARDPRIRVIHKENGGLSSARNAGMEIARGRYLCFVDSDDYIVENTVGRILDWINDENADVCFLATRKVYPDGKQTELAEELQRRELYRKSREEGLRHLASRPIYPGSAWAKLWKRQFLEENHFRFPADRRLSEDLIFCMNAYIAAKKLDCLEFPFYCYRQDRPGSITSNVSARYYFDTFLFVQEAADRYRTQADSAEGEFALAAAAYEYAIRLGEVYDLDGEDQEKAWKLLTDYRWVLKHSRCGKTRLVSRCAFMLGLKNTARLLTFYQKHRT